MELIILGVFIGIISGFFGIGGGTLLVPLLLYFNFDLKIAIGISIIQMVFSSIFGTYLNQKAGLLNLKDGLFLGLGGMFGAFWSGLLVKVIPNQILILIFLSFVIFAIYKFFQTPLNIKNNNNKNKTNKLILFIVGSCIGLLAISVGIGGSLLLTPILVGYLLYNPKTASSMGLFFVIFSSVSGLISFSIYGDIDYLSGLIIGGSSLFGVYFGVKLKVKSEITKYKQYLLYLYIFIFLITVNKLIY